MILRDFIQAHQQLKPYLTPTPFEAAPKLSDGIYFKLENLNPTHAFKIRGALNATLAQEEVAREQGIVAASAGNHAMGVAYAAQLIGAEVTLVMPSDAPQRKIKGAEQYGAQVILHGDIYDDAENYARQLEAESGKLFISPYNDPYIIAGQGTISLEIFEQLPDVKRILVPTSGGGLLAGIATAAKLIDPDIEIIGVQSVATPAMYNVFYATDHPQLPTIADGLAGEIEAGAITVPLCQQYTDQIVLVDEAAIIEAIDWMFRQHGWVIEGAAAVGIAAILAQAIKPSDETVIIISGGNIDADKFLKMVR